MSAFSSLFGAARAVQQALRAQSIPFQPADESKDAETVSAIVGAIDESIFQEENTELKNQRRLIEVPIAVVEGGPSERIRGGVYTIDGDAWVVHHEVVFSNNTGMATLELRRAQRMEQAGRREARMSDSGLIIGPLENLRSLIAASANWQTWTGATNATQARTRTFLLEPPPESDEVYSKDELEIRRPYVVTDWFANRTGSGGESAVVDLSALGLFSATANLFATFEADTPKEMLADAKTALLWFSRKVETVVTDMLDLAQGSGEYLNVQKAQLFTPPFRSPLTDRETLGDYWRTTLIFAVAEYPV